MSKKEENSPVEKPVTDPKKVKVYLGVTLGFILLCGFLIILSGHRQSPKKTPTASTASTQGPGLSPLQAFSKSVAQKRADVEQQQNSAPSLAAMSGDHSTGTGASHTAKRAIDPVMQAREKFKLQEVTRALKASQAQWGGFKAVAGQSQQNNRSQTQDTPQPTSLQSQLEAVKVRILKTQKLRDQIESGNFSALPVSTQSQTKSQLSSLLETFKPPPKDIVGYTMTNKYDADIAGKMKLPIGTVIPAITAMKTISDYPGTLKGIVTQDIYDTSYRYVLIPKGSDVIMKSVKASNINAPIQARMGIIVQWVILPNGDKIDFSKSAGLDRNGVPALKDKVSYHFLEQFLGVAAYALVSNQSSYQGTGANNDQSYKGNVSDGLRKQLSPLVQRYLNLVPTITLDAGQSMNIVLEDEIYLKPWKDTYKDYES